MKKRLAMSSILMSVVVSLCAQVMQVHMHNASSSYFSHHKLDSVTFDTKNPVMRVFQKSTSTDFNTDALDSVSFPLSLASDKVQLVFEPKDGEYEMNLMSYGTRFVPEGEKAVHVQLWGANFSTEQWCSANYNKIERKDGTLVCTAIVSTQAGSKMTVKDIYSIVPERGTLSMNRSVIINSKKTADAGFNTLFMLREADKRKLTDVEYLIPSIMYKDNSGLAETSIASDMTDKWILVREERCALPFSMLRNKKTGVGISVNDYNLSPTTYADDQGINNVFNNYAHYGSVGFFLGEGYPVVAYCYPGSEGEHSYSDWVGSKDKRWSRRAHLFSISNKIHKYTLEIDFSQTADFASAVQNHYSSAFDMYSPDILSVKSETVLDQSLDLLSTYYVESDNGAAGFPFSVWLDGRVNETSFDGGFVGMQVSCGYYLYRTGVETGNETYRKQGEKVLDFWASHCINAQGMPMVWWDISPFNSFRNYNDLRNMQGMMEALIMAWNVAEKYAPGTKATWLQACEDAANWMLQNQQTDGALYKAFDNNAAVIDNGKMLTSNVVRFLSYMYKATGVETFRNGAIRAGEFCMKNIDAPYKYIGSVIDNPYVKDRESGQKMIEAMLCIYDLTGEQRWLDAAVRAAYYTATYMYAWNIPGENGREGQMPWPKTKSISGITIIATGHSGADAGFSYNSFELMRLYLLTGDEHLLRIAEMLEKNTKQTMDYDGSLHYGHRALQTEALRVVTPRGANVNLWLPWLTAAALDPLYKMNDAFGRMNIDQMVEEVSLDRLKAQGDAYGRTLGFADKGVTNDYTAAVMNPTYRQNTNAGWKGDVPGFQSWGNAEFWNRNFSYNQKITGLPAGTYRVSVQAFYRAGETPAQDEKDSKEGKASNALLYATTSAGTVSVPLAHLTSEGSNASLGGGELTASGLYYPNTMASAFNYFEKGMYDNSIMVEVGSDGTLTIGLKKSALIAADWTIWDNWRLERVK